MSHFIQLHLLTSYPPANLNRDDLGRPKTAVMGGVTRLRISSQSLKRAWRKSELFEEALAGHLGTRTKDMGNEILKKLIQKEVNEKKALEWAKAIAAKFGKVKKDSAEIEQLAHFSPEERQAIDALVDTLAQEGRAPTDDELNLLREQHQAADIALFGRMLASAPKYNMEAAAQVAHAISVHKVAIEDDFFTAVDDLNEDKDETGAGHMGETEFAAGLFYQYICIDKKLLARNLKQDDALVKKTLAALTEAVAKIAPTGKQNSFASRAHASFILAEKGDQQPRSLSVAFLDPVTGKRINPETKKPYKGMSDEAITILIDTRNNMNKVYGECADSHTVMNAVEAKGTLQELIDFVVE